MRKRRKRTYCEIWWERRGVEEGKKGDQKGGEEINSARGDEMGEEESSFKAVIEI